MFFLRTWFLLSIPGFFHWPYNFAGPRFSWYIIIPMDGSLGRHLEHVPKNWLKMDLSNQKRNPKMG